MTGEEEIKKLVLVRLEAMSPEISVSMGGKEFSKEDLIKEIKKESEIGKSIIEMQLAYLKAMKTVQ